VKKRSRIRKAIINICNTVRFSFAEEIFKVSTNFLGTTENRKRCGDEQTPVEGIK